MANDQQVLRLSEHEGVDRLNSIDQFLRQSENSELEIDVSGTDVISTPVLQMIICATQHWSQRDLPILITGSSDKLRSNLTLIGADLNDFMQKEVQE